jgi:hypothetical protein
LLCTSLRNLRRIAIVLTGVFVLLQPLTNIAAQAATTSPNGGTGRMPGCYVGEQVTHKNWVVYFSNGGIGITVPPPVGESPRTSDFGFTIDGGHGSGPVMGDDVFGPLVYGNPSFTVSDNTLTDPKLWVGDPTVVQWSLPTNDSWRYQYQGQVYYGYGAWQFEGAQFYYDGAWHAIPPTYHRHVFQAPNKASIRWYRVCASYREIVPPGEVLGNQKRYRGDTAILTAMAESGWSVLDWTLWVLVGSCLLGLSIWLFIRPRRRRQRSTTP